MNMSAQKFSRASPGAPDTAPLISSSVTLALVFLDVSSGPPRLLYFVGARRAHGWPLS
jgi:hypothetical protein